MGEMCSETRMITLGGANPEVQLESPKPRCEKECRAIDLVDPAVNRRGDIECRIGSSREELFAAFRLVYGQYVRAGLMKQNPYQMRVTPYHLLPTTEVIVALDRGTVTCTMTLVRDGELGLPMGSVYHEEVACHRLQELSLAEVSCLADAHEQATKSQSALFQLMPLLAQLAYYRGVDRLMIAVHPRHARFYHRFLGFDVIAAEERTYGQVCGKPAIALAMDLRGLATNHPRVHQWLFGTPFPHAVMQPMPIPSQLLNELQIVVDKNYGGMSPQERERELAA
jgi:hypothetical protein